MNPDTSVTKTLNWVTFPSLVSENMAVHKVFRTHTQTHSRTNTQKQNASGAGWGGAGIKILGSNFTFLLIFGK